MNHSSVLSEAAEISAAVHSGDRRRVERMLGEHLPFLRQVIGLRMNGRIAARSESTESGLLLVVGTYLLPRRKWGKE